MFSKELYIAFDYMLMMFSILGFSNTLSGLTRIPINLAIFAVTLLLLIVQFVGALTHMISVGSNILVWLGCGLFLITGICYWCFQRYSRVGRDILIVNAIYCLLFILMIMACRGLPFHSIDDYAFWGVMGKYIFIFHRLPTAPTVLDAEHLAYTPGLASFHYLFHSVSGHYSKWSAYVAQGTLILGCFITLVRADRLFNSLLGLAYTMLIFGCVFGFYLGNLQAGPVLGAVVFVMFFIVTSSYSQKHKFLVLAPCLVSLFLIKQIGLLFAFFGIFALLLIDYKDRDNRIQLWCYFLSMSLILVFVHLGWVRHFQNAGFHYFATGAKPTEVLQSLNPFSIKYHLSQWLMIKELVVGSFDKLLGIPYLLIYALLWWMSKKIIQWGRDSGLTVPPQTDIHKIMFLFVGFLVCYALLIYFLEVFTFGVGIDRLHLLSFSRYYNVLLGPVFLVVFQHWYAGILRKRSLSLRSKKKFLYAAMIMLLVPIMIFGGRLQALRRDAYKPIRLIAKTINQAIGLRQKLTVCISGFPGPNYNTLLPLQYYLLPNRVEELEVAIKQHINCDFILRYGKKSSLASYHLKKVLPFKHGKVYLFFLRNKH